MNKYIAGILLLILIGGIWTLAKRTEEVDNRVIISSALYICDGGHTLEAHFYNNPDDATRSRSVDISIDGSTLETLGEAISANGNRYSRTDETLTFWNKGEEALIMRNNVMDQKYTNCRASWVSEEH